MTSLFKFGFLMGGDLSQRGAVGLFDLILHNPHIVAAWV